MASHKPLRIFFSAGEPSGDLHGANLIRQLRGRCVRVEAVGYGGPHMAAAGCSLHADLTSLAVMWFARALANLPKFWGLVGRADRYFQQHRPDAVVLIDYPGFNWWIARRAKAHGIPVFYYTPPQIWAWAQWRVWKMRRLVDHVLCSLPFEEAWLRQHGCRATFVGHPFFDEVRRQEVDVAFLERMGRGPGPLVAILPGSRTQEVTHNLKWFLKAAGYVRQAVPEVRFAVAAFNQHQAEIAAGERELATLARKSREGEEFLLKEEILRSRKLTEAKIARAKEELAALQHRKRAMVESHFTAWKVFILLAGPVLVLLIPASVLAARLLGRVEWTKRKPWTRGI